MQRIDWQKYEPFQVICNRRDRSRSRRVIHPRVAAKSAQSVLPIRSSNPKSAARLDRTQYDCSG